MASIILDSVTLDFPIFNLNARSLKKRLLRLTTGGALNNSNDCVVIKALDKISLQLNDGDRVGLIGHNGAGKSTLLRVLANIYVPTSGTIHYQGKISTLLDFMLGFNLESTGYENIICSGIVHGLTKKQISAKSQEIAEFTELGDYLYVPVRTYSSGMLMRLAFAVATSIHPEILLIDEIIGVGDKKFIDKAQQRLNSLIEKSNIVVLASHSIDIIKSLCNKALILNSGRIEWFGPIEQLPR